jgi:hypothetical protein
MNASLQGFNLVRIESHFNVSLPLTTCRHGCSIVMVSCSKIDLLWMYNHHGYFGRESRVNLPIFHQNRPAFGNFQRSQTTADADNTLKIKGNKTVTTVSDSRRCAQMGYMIRDGIR